MRDSGLGYIPGTVVPILKNFGETDGRAEVMALSEMLSVISF